MKREQRPDPVYFGSKHPAEGRPCPTCKARIGKPCVALTSMPGTCVSEGSAITGIHYERLAAADEASA